MRRNTILLLIIFISLLGYLSLAQFLDLQPNQLWQQVFQKEPKLADLLKMQPELDIEIVNKATPPLDDSWKLIDPDTRIYQYVERESIGEGAYERRHYTQLEKSGVFWTDYEAESEAAVIWIFQTKIRPKINTMYEVYLLNPSYDANDFLKGLILQGRRFLKDHAEKFGTSFERELEWLTIMDQKREEPSEATGWIEIHDGVWERELESELWGRTRVTHYTEKPENLQWLIDNRLAPAAEVARQKVEELGEEKAEQLGYLDDIFQYELALKTVESKKK